MAPDEHHSPMGCHFEEATCASWLVPGRADTRSGDWVDALKSDGSEFTVWDETVTGFGVRVRPTGAKSYVVVYRAGSGRGAPVRRYTIAAVGKIAPEREPRSF
jgi:hypothetical protein